MAPTDELLVREKECALHQRLLDRDSAATADAASLFWQRLVEWIKARNRFIDEHICCDAANEAFLNYLKNPASFDPESGKSLFGYLCMSASGDLKNLLAKGRRHSSKTIPIDSVELSPTAGNHLGEEDGSLRRLELQEEAILTEPVVNAIKLGLPPDELVALELYLDGEKKTDA